MNGFKTQLLTVILQPLHHSKPHSVYPVGQEHCSGSWAVNEVYEAAAKSCASVCDLRQTPTLHPQALDTPATCWKTLDT